MKINLDSGTELALGVLSQTETKAEPESFSPVGNENHSETPSLSLLFSVYLILLSHCCPSSAHEFTVQTTVTKIRNRSQPILLSPRFGS